MKSIIARELVYTMKGPSPFLMNPPAAIPTQILLAVAAVVRRLRILTLVANTIEHHVCRSLAREQARAGSVKGGRVSTAITDFRRRSAVARDN